MLEFKIEPKIRNKPMSNHFKVEFSKEIKQKRKISNISLITSSKHRKKKLHGESSSD